MKSAGSNVIRKACGKQFCINVINALDPVFLPSCAREIKQEVIKAKKIAENNYYLNYTDLLTNFNS